MTGVSGRRVRWRARRILDAPLAAVWSALTRPAVWPQWGPSLTSASGPPTIGPGSRGTVTPILGPELSWTVDAFAANRFWSWRVGGVAATGHEVAPAPPAETGEPRTEVIFDAPWWAPFYVPVLHLGLRRLADLVEGAAEGPVSETAHPQPAEIAEDGR